MPLDAAEFISELSILDPTGTDPINQGDDQIRTVKRATQQSFPNVNAAVPQTAAQMAQMAIKNEVNIFTQLQAFNAQINAQASSTAAAPAYSFTGDATTGMFRDTAGRVSFASSGSLVFLMQNALCQSQVVFRVPDGSAAAPGLSFTNQPGTGMYRPGTSLGFAVNGSDAAFLLPAQFRMIANGSAAAPSYAFQSSSNAGMYRLSSTAIGFAQSGVTQLVLSTVGADFAQRLGAPDGTEAAPAYTFASDLTTGLFVGANAVNVSVLGSQIFAMSSAGLFASAGIAFAGDGGLLAPVAAFSFGNDSDTGMFRLAANVLGFSAGALTDFTMSLEGRNVSTVLKLNQTAGTGAVINTLRDTVLRWAFGATSADQDFWTISRFNDAGGFVGNPFQINRANGNISMVLPTSNPGGSNILWRNGNVVNIT